MIAIMRMLFGAVMRSVVRDVERAMVRDFERAAMRSERRGLSRVFRRLGGRVSSPGSSPGSGSGQSSHDLIVQVMQSQTVRDRLEEVARQIATRAQVIAQNEGVTMDVWVESSTRPGGRPTSKVMSDNVDQEWGSRDSERRRILGRAADGFGTPMAIEVSPRDV